MSFVASSLQTGLNVLLALGILACLAWLARKVPLLGYLQALVLAAFPLLLFGAAHSQQGEPGYTAFVIGVIAVIAAVVLWPLAWSLFNIARHGTREAAEAALEQRARKPRPPTNPAWWDTHPMVDTVELQVMQDDGKVDMLLQARKPLLWSLAVTVLWAALLFSGFVQWVHSGILEMGMALAWLASWFVGMTGVRRVATLKGLGRITTGICMILSLVPILNLLVFLVFALKATPRPDWMPRRQAG